MGRRRLEVKWEDLFLPNPHFGGPLFTAISIDVAGMLFENLGSAMTQLAQTRAIPGTRRLLTLRRGIGDHVLGPRR